MSVIVNGPSLAPITAAAGGVFNVIAGEPGAGAQGTMNLPGSGKFNGQQFVVRASGTVSFPAGTYTSSIQPFLYASTIAGYTASAAAAIYSNTAAVAVTITSATAKTASSWQFEVHCEGDSTTGTLNGWAIGAYSSTATEANSFIDVGSIVQNTTGINFSNEPPLQFAIGVTLGATALATTVCSVNQWSITAD